MTIVLFDTPISRGQLYPFSTTRPISTVRHGIFTGLEWYGLISGLPVVSLSSGLLSPSLPADGSFLCVDASVIPTTQLFEEIKGLEPGEMLEDELGIIAWHSGTLPVYGSLPLFLSGKKTGNEVERVQHPMDWVKTNAAKIAADVVALQNKVPTLQETNGNRVFGKFPVYIGEGVSVQGCIFNTGDGPVHIGSGALLMEGSQFRGPVAIGEGAVVKMGSQVYGGTTIGKKCTAGGEIKNSIIGDFSNKAHHGYLGDSIIGQWCNLGAGTTNSNVKNNAGIIRMWSGALKSLIPIGQKAGMVMGDFSKTAINTSINSGTTIGACCSLHSEGLTGKHIPSFSWGFAERYQFHKLKRDIEQWMDFKHETPGPGWWLFLQALYREQPNPYDENHG